MKPNFTLDLNKLSLLETIKVLIQLNELTMNPNELTLAVHDTMTYKVQIYIFSMNYNDLPITMGKKNHLTQSLQAKSIDLHMGFR